MVLIYILFHFSDSICSTQNMTRFVVFAFLVSHSDSVILNCQNILAHQLLFKLHTFTLSSILVLLLACHNIFPLNPSDYNMSVHRTIIKPWQFLNNLLAMSPPTV